MGLKSRTIQFRNYVSRKIAYTGNNDYLKDSFPEVYGNFLTSNKATLKHAAVWSCVRLLSEVPASLPRMVYKNNAKGGKDPQPLHLVNRLLHKPNRYMTGVVYDQVVFGDYHLKGNHVSVIVRKGGKGVGAANPVELLPIKWANVRMFFNDGILYYEVSSTIWGLDKVAVPYFDVVHYKNFSEDGFVGRSTLEYARETIESGQHENAFQRTFWEKGGIARNVIESERPFPSGNAWTEWKTKFKEANGGLDGNHSTIWLDDTKKLKQLQLPVPDQKFINLKTFTVQDVCRFFGVPPHMVYDLLKSSYSSLEQQNRAWVQNRLRPDVKNIEEEKELKLFTEVEQVDHHVKYILDGLLRGNMNEIASLIQILVQVGVISRDEARVTYLNLNPLGGDMAKPLTPAFLVGKQTEALEKVKKKLGDRKDLKEAQELRDIIDNHLTQLGNE